MALLLVVYGTWVPEKMDALSLRVEFHEEPHVGDALQSLSRTAVVLF